MKRAMVVNADQSLSQVLRTEIAQSEMSMYELAKRAGISPIMISRFVRGERDFRLATADKLATILGLRLSGHPDIQP